MALQFKLPVELLGLEGPFKDQLVNDQLMTLPVISLFLRQNLLTKVG